MKNMKTNIFLSKTIKYVDDLFGQKDEHFVRSLYWVNQFEAHADEALQIAAYAHDTERALYPYNIRAFLLDADVLKKHQENGAAAIYAFLLKENAAPDLALKVGTHEQNLLKDADSISYFETNSIKHTEWTDKLSKEEIKAKFDWMYNRISLDSAKIIAKPLYEKVLILLKKK
jgi:hypothetical protein